MSQSARSPTSITLRWVVRRAFWISGGTSVAWRRRSTTSSAACRAISRPIGSTVRSVAWCFSLSMPSSAPVCSAMTASAERMRSCAWSSRPSSERGDMRGALSTLDASCRSTAWTMRSFALVSTRSPTMSAIVASTRAARSATSSDWTRSSTSTAAASRSRAALARSVSSICAPCSATRVRRSSISSRRLR